MDRVGGTGPGTRAVQPAVSTGACGFAGVSSAGNISTAGFAVFVFLSHPKKPVQPGCAVCGSSGQNPLANTSHILGVKTSSFL